MIPPEFTQTPRRSLNGFVVSVRLFGALQPGQLLNVDPDGVSYDVFIHQINNTVPKLTPPVRVATGVKINSAKPGQPCIVTLETGQFPFLSIVEEIVFSPCTPQTGGTGG